MMLRFFRLFGSQYVGFWFIGLLLFAFQEIPYMVMPLFHLKQNPIMNMTETSKALDICEKLLGSLCIVLMTFIVHKDSKLLSISSGSEKLFFALTAAVLLLNFIGWGFYFAGHQSFFVMMFFIVLLPPLYYVFIGLWRRNYILAVAGCIFTAVHFAHVWGNLKK